MVMVGGDLVALELRIEEIEAVCGVPQGVPTPPAAPMVDQLQALEATLRQREALLSAPALDALREGDTCLAYSVVEGGWKECVIVAPPSHQTYRVRFVSNHQERDVPFEGIRPAPLDLVSLGNARETLAGLVRAAGVKLQGGARGGEDDSAAVLGVPLTPAAKQAAVLSAEPDLERAAADLARIRDLVGEEASSGGDTLVPTSEQSSGLADAERATHGAAAGSQVLRQRVDRLLAQHTRLVDLLNDKMAEWDAALRHAEAINASKNG